MADPRKLEALRRSRLSVELDDAQCAIVADMITLRTLKEGEVLCPQGHSDSHIHVVTSGALAVVKPAGADEWETLATLNAGDLVGELSFMDGEPYSAEIRAVGRTEIFSLAREQLEAILEKHPAVVYRVLRAIMRVVHGILRRLNMQSTELSNYVYKQHGRY